MAKETQLWDWLRMGILKQLPVGCSTLRIDRIESFVTPGFPDTSYTYLGVSGHIELKSVPSNPVRPGSKVFGTRGLNIDQINWHRREAYAGGFHYIFARAGKMKWLVSGAYADDFNDATAQQLTRMARFWKEGDWDRTDWMIFLTCLKTKRSGE